MSQPIVSGLAELHLGDCLHVMPTLPASSVDAIITDPPYGLGFMGKHWDHGVPGVDFWVEALRVAKPGAHLLAFGGTRMFHRLAVAIEDAGWEIRDCVMWVYGSGFPKSLDVSKAIDKAAGAEREVIGSRKKRGLGGSETFAQDAWTQAQRGVIDLDITAPATDDAKQWQGWGTALKPAWEPVIVARKPLIGTVAANVLEHRVGALNIDRTRIATDENPSGARRASRSPKKESGSWANDRRSPETFAAVRAGESLGRWPANLIHDGSEEVLELFPKSKSTGGQASLGAFRNGDVYGKGRDERESRDPGYGDNGSAARFFYCAKASKKDRNEGLEDAPDTILARSCQAAAEAQRGNTVERESGAFNKARIVKNNHPTVKPTDLMRYLCRLVTPAEGVVLDPFMGSGSTGKAAVKEGFRFIGIEREKDYVAIAKARIDDAQQQPTLNLEPAA